MNINFNYGTFRQRNQLIYSFVHTQQLQCWQGLPLRIVNILAYITSKIAEYAEKPEVGAWIRHNFEARWECLGVTHQSPLTVQHSTVVDWLSARKLMHCNRSEFAIVHYARNDVYREFVTKYDFSSSYPVVTVMHENSRIWDPKSKVFSE